MAHRIRRPNIPEGQTQSQRSLHSSKNSQSPPAGMRAGTALLGRAVWQFRIQSSPHSQHDSTSTLPGTGLTDLTVYASCTYTSFQQLYSEWPKGDVTRMSPSCSTHDPALAPWATVLQAPAMQNSFPMQPGESQMHRPSERGWS